MKTLKNQLLSICESLTTLAEQVKSVSEYIDQLPETAAQDTTPKEAPAAVKSCQARKSKPQETESSSGPGTIIQTESVPVLATVYDIIKRSRKGVSIDKLRKKTDFSPKQISNALYKLSNKGKIVAQSRGIYIKK